ncbi:hypothetical protein KUTeg_020835 [Tegillarca granosa]|uniref:RabBD domain-containing protein n=1 Tax=Tegillarca granosa TaxID=220873 RepID=A0ABQ9E935_TEGGR|nr:hypothetical protein KUTeg_020835 [Tegillarca granosa]
MGNENSSIPSDATTPTSEWQSVQSFGSKRRSSVSSTRIPTPVEAPEPDLSHLSEEEIAQIRAVLDRAKEMQHEEHIRIRSIEQTLNNQEISELWSVPFSNKENRLGQIIKRQSFEMLQVYLLRNVNFLTDNAESNQSHKACLELTRKYTVITRH